MNIRSLYFSGPLLTLMLGLCLTGCRMSQRPASVAAGAAAVKEALADSAMVVSAHPLATGIGVEVLQRGGNAIDAAVAVQFALAVVYPQAGNIGGGGFLVYREKNGAVSALDYRERAPGAATETMFQDASGQVLPDKSRFGVFAAGVPGTVDGMWEAHQRYGRLAWKSLVEPAARLAERGFRISAQEAQNLNAEQANFAKYSSGSTPNPFLSPKGSWTAGDWLLQPALGATLRRVAEQGRDGFYLGTTAELLVEEMQRQKGPMTLEDIRTYHSVWRQPLEFDYRDLHLITMPPPSSGGIILQQLLGSMELYPLQGYGFHSVAAVHLMAEAERRAYADRAMHHGDPDYWNVPVKRLTNPAYIRRRMADYDPHHATPSARIEAGLLKESSETTHYSIVDAQGNAASVTTTLNDSYGSRVVVGGAGFILNNEMDDFSAKPGAPNLYGAVGGKANAVAAGKRPLSSMTPTIVTRNGQLWMVVGTPGGTTIPTSVFQTIVNVADFHLSLPEAVQSGRFHHQWKPDAIQIEPGALSDSVQHELSRMGHTISVRSGPFGRVEAILRLPNGKWQGVADTRGNDAAMGY